MDKFVAIFVMLLSLSASSYAQTCSRYTGFPNGVVYRTCQDLPELNSFLHWNYHASNHTVDIAYRQPGMSRSNWVAWALNPTRPVMIGSQCLVARHYSSGAVRAYTSQIDSYATQLLEGNLTFGVTRLRAEFKNGEMVIFARVELPPGSGTRSNQVWQFGEVISNVPQAHATTGPNLRSVGTIDFANNGF